MNAANISSCILSNKEQLTCNYVPTTIPEGVLWVHIKDFISQNDNFQIHNDLFRSENWTNVQYLEFTNIKKEKYPSVQINSAAFIHLENLKVLKLRMENLIELDPDAFTGLKTLQSLEVSKCYRLSADNVTAALRGSEKIPNLEQLYLSELQVYWDGFKVDENFCRSFQDKPLRVLDLSGTHVTKLNLITLRYLNDLEVLNGSFATVDHIISNFNLVDNPKRLKVLDINDIMITNLITPSISKDIILANIHFPLDINGVFQYTPDVLNITGLISKHTISIYNTSVWCPSIQKLWSKQIFARQNRMRRADLNMDCKNCYFTSLLQFDGAYNDLEYVNPSILSCFPNIEHFDLSGNRLYIMYEETNELFVQLLNNFEKLISINLASNNLTDLPEDFFAKKIHLTSINLQENKVTQVHFKLFHLKQLLLLDITNNDIKLLDSLSTRRLDALNIYEICKNDSISKEASKSNPDDKPPPRNIQVKLGGNPFICDSCKTLPLIRWLTKTDIISSDELTCHDENGKLLKMNNAVNVVQKICNRTIRLLIITVTCVVIGFIVLTIIFLIRRRRRAQREMLRNNNIEILRDDNERFAVFLSFCSSDEDFVSLDH
ncbi:Toll-like receptor 7 [Mactra antiquata]